MYLNSFDERRIDRLLQIRSNNIETFTTISLIGIGQLSCKSASVYCEGETCSAIGLE
jgi:hypothetical protein